jgi:signal transduction histidine kinase
VSPQAFDAGDALDAVDALSALGAAVLCVDEDLRVAFANAAWARVAGAEAARGVRLFDALDDRAATAHDSLVRAVLADGVARDFRVVPTRPGVPALDVRVTRSGRGRLVLLAERAGAAAPTEARELAAEHERLRVLARAMAAEEDADALLDVVCRAAVELCDARGGTVAEIEGDVGTFICAVGHPNELRGRRFRLAGTLSARALDEYRATGRLTAARADAGEADDGALYPYLSDGRLVGPLLLAPLGAHGELLGVLALSRAFGEAPFDDGDEDRLRVIADHASLALWKARLIEEALAANAMKSNFLAMVSHELRTPLTALAGYGELLADEIVGPLTRDQHDIVDRLRSVTNQLTAMIEEILTFSSLEAGRELVCTRQFDAAEVLRGVAAVVEPLATAKGLAFVCEMAVGLGPMVSDPDKVRQIVINLAGNGVKFTERGEVRIRVAPEPDGCVAFAVTDTGVGIAPSDVNRLFQPFTQLDTGLTRRYGGTGLGLYISRRLAELLGGHVEVASEPGRGSTFTLVLPAEGRP